MSGLEGSHIQKTDIAVAPPSADEQREYYFRALVLAQLLRTVEQTLEDTEFSEQEVNEFITTLASLGEKDQRAILSIPFELRTRLYTTYHTKIVSGQLTVADMVRDLAAKNRAFGFTTGYHLSDRQIPKTKVGNAVQWNIDGRELDDRDEMLMAYYSEDYANRYKKKPARYLYVVRAELGSSTSHKRDTSNRWGRAPSLSIIDELDMREIEQALDDKIKRIATPESGAAISEAA